MHLAKEPSRVPVWLDCDPGNDDAFAILLAALHPDFHLVGMSTVHGNAPLSSTSHNAVALLDVLGFRQDEIKVYAGSDKPLEKEPHYALEVHGETGIGGATLPEHPKIVLSTDKGYLEAMRDAIEEYKHDICIVCTGAMTNFAKLIQKYPHTKSQIRIISIMGGAINTGNVTPFTEFNMLCDPKAAALVLEDPELAEKTILCPLNLTHTALANEHIRKAMYDPKSNHNSSIRLMFFQIVTFYFESYTRNNEHLAGPPAHDPLAMFLLLPMLSRNISAQRLFTEECDFHYLRRKLKVIQSGEHEGETVIANGDLDPLKEEEGGVYVGRSIHVPMFWNYMLKALELADKQVSARQIH